MFILTITITTVHIALHTFICAHDAEKLRCERQFWREVVCMCVWCEWC